MVEKADLTMRIALTGAGGFLGSRLAERLVAEGHFVRALVRATNVPRWLEERGAELLVGDVTQEASQRALVAGCDIVFHVAGLVTEVAAGETEYTRVNVEGSGDLAQAAIDAGARRIVFVSSTSVHAPNGGAPLEESSPFEPADAYGRSKAEAERRLTRLVRGTQAELGIVRPSRIYGPRDVSLGRVFRAIARRRLLLVGACTAETDFVYVDDVVAALVRSATRGDGVYVVGGPERVSIERFLVEIARALGRRLPPVRLPFGPTLVASAVLARAYTAFGREPPLAPKRLAFFRNGRVVDHSRARCDLGYDPAVGVREGVERTVRWYQQAGWL
jgi:nucleoside-diphosphate-sugar epimerase